MLPAWASARIQREVEAFQSEDTSLVELVQRLRAWFVYGDLGGSLLIGIDGEVYSQDHNTMECRPEPDPRWRQLAWVVAAEQAPELRALLPARPPNTPDCPGCGGAGRIPMGQVSPICGGCWGLGWQREFAAGE
jgi:hypothetical protein